MTALRVHVELDGRVELVRRLAGLSGKLEDFRPLGERLEPVIYERIGEHFKSEGGGEWEPLSPRYAAWKQANYPGQPIMVREGTLEAALTGRGSEGAIRRIDRDGGEWGTDLPYAAAHHRSKRERPPERRLIVVDSDMRRDLLDAMTEYVRERVRTT